MGGLIREARDLESIRKEVERREGGQGEGQGGDTSSEGGGESSKGKK
jgi:hypothetical protein